MPTRKGSVLFFYSVQYCSSWIVCEGDCY